jgi:hypothetical protein
MSRAIAFPYADTKKNISIAVSTYGDSLLCADPEPVQFACDKASKHLWTALVIFFPNMQYRSGRT